jgi:hypothetical protein
MIVEFIGVPGVGKTTVLERMKFVNGQENFNIIFKSSDLKQLCHARSALFVLRFIVGCTASLKLLFTSFRWLIVKLSHRECVCVVDENESYIFPLKTSGMLMPIISYIVQRNTDNVEFNISEVLDMLALPDVLIVVTASIETIVERYSSRGGYTLPDRKSRQSVVVNSDLYNKFNSGIRAVEEIVELLQKKGVRILRIDNNQDLNNDKLKFIMKEIISG